MAEHAKLSPSGAKLDMACPGNRREQAKYPRSSSSASAKGTGMHCMAASCLLRNHEADKYIGWWCGENAQGADYLMRDKPEAAGTKGFWSFQIDAENAQNVQLYLDHVRGVLASAGPQGRLVVEERVKLTDNIWGTPDASVSVPYLWLHITDYKNGYTFVPESSEQLKLYLLAKMGLTNPFGYQKLYATIAQPNSTHDEAIRTIEYDVQELLDWYEFEYAPAAARCIDPNAPCIPGDWCKSAWCNARFSCEARAALCDAVTDGMFTSVVELGQLRTLPAPAIMTADVIAKVLNYGDVVIDWIKDIKAHEYKLAMSQNNTWGKLVQGKSSRDWKDREIAKQRLMKMLHGNVYGDQTLMTPAAVEGVLKTMGHKPKEAKAMIAELVLKSTGKPKLVHMDAKGEPFDPVSDMFTDTTTQET